jgi:DNA-directed RNA polymerase specialized sigma24 family protein
VSRPDEEVELAVDSPLRPKDQAYLLELLQAGTKAELARRTGVSRAAVTQRVQRIRSRIDALAQQDRLTHDVWMSQAARRVLERAEPHTPFV